MTPERYRKVTGTALALLVLIVMTGVSVRLTESGLGCSDWPTCEQDQFVADLEIHAMIEFVNRLITGLVSIAVIAAVLGSLFRKPRRRDLTRLSLGLVAGMVGQIVLGGIVVLSHLNPWLVLNHFLLSMILVANAVVLHSRASPGWRPTDQTGRSHRWAITILAATAIVLGTFVTGAGPHGGNRDGQNIERLPLEVRQVVRIHSITVILLMALVLVVVARLHRADADPGERWRGRMLLLALIAQGGVGYLQYFTGVPVILVGVHVAGACAVWIFTLWFHLNSSPEPVEVGRGDTGSRPTDSILVT